ncbi:DUF4980 domain-containing protein [Galbibacter pacificus]|uniref:DUF4980 domain-containing protein n=1 Tax=Galbibacter pacificus TaxID=2996052 RepID=A0ABT6FMU5_9FLAO|nr:DUF4980 domain-containing protein [Galbibacter pacificus]MDG3581103.1 DUF4980 domain-containing protein [Galbibacter pacificus]MDG3584581.1 DUF4980 domain-containing protein [Galbibacter pacificus]
MKKFFIYIFIATLPMLVMAQDDQNGQSQQSPLNIQASKKWLLLPVKNGVKREKVVLYHGNEQLRSFDIELTNEAPDWYAYLDISEWKGKSLKLDVKTGANMSKALSMIQQSDKEKDAKTLYHEKKRAQFHFSPKRGWNNDPNGLVYYKGEYHLFFQHNPYGVEWGNMHWGHAVSKDLVHWKEVGEALYPDSFGTMFSGSAVVDKNNTSTLGNDSRVPMVLFYTAEGSWIQGLAYSTDGREFKKLKNPVVSKFTDGNRDPKVIWHEPSKKWVMVVYVELEGKQHTMHFLTSPNLKDWETSSIVKGGIDNDRYLFECPEFYQLEVEGNPDIKKWILTGANSEYAIGTFDGEEFTPEQEKLNGQHGRDFYAAQTFNNEPKGRRIEIGWWRTHTGGDGNNFNQSMSIPMEIKLLETSDGLRIARQPVEELKELRKKHHTFEDSEINDGKAFQFKNIKSDLLEIHTKFTSITSNQIELSIKGVKAIYNVKTETLSIDGVDAHLPLTSNQLDLTIYVDRTGLEIFAQNGVFFMPVNINIDGNNKDINLTVKGGSIHATSEVYELKSIWK